MVDASKIASIAVTNGNTGEQKTVTGKRHIAMNTLPNVTMMMEKYKSREGDIEISNQSGKGLKTWEWYDIQKWENGE